jgi:activator of 2-hydroxyglutaryl-CoA dehydratase
MKMITAGIDVGTETTKVIILSDNEIDFAVGEPIYSNQQ